MNIDNSQLRYVRICAAGLYRLLRRRTKVLIVSSDTGVNVLAFFVSSIAYSDKVFASHNDHKVYLSLNAPISTVIYSSTTPLCLKANIHNGH